MDMRARRTSLVAVAALALASGIAPIASGDTPDPAGDVQTTGRLIATLELPARPTADTRSADRRRDDLDGRAAGLIDSVVKRTGVHVADRVPEAAIFSASPAPGQSLGGLRGELLADPAVASVEAEIAYQLRYAPNDTAYNTHDPNAPNSDFTQWNLSRESFEAGWDLSKGAGAKVAIVDTGTSSTQPDLDHIARALDNDTTSPTGAQSDEDGHGTHVSGLACADSDNGYGIASAGFDCQLIVEKADVGANHTLGVASLVSGIVDAADSGADVINMSWGGAGQSSTLLDAINYAWQRNVVLVSAAENTSTTDQAFPARYLQPTGSSPNPGACNQGDISAGGCARGLVVTMAGYDGANAGAGFGTGITVAAFGDSLPSLPGAIFSTYPANNTTREDSTCLVLNPPPATCPPRITFAGDRRWAYLAGTSMATPQVSGLAALMRSAQPGMPAADVIRIIKQTASNGGAYGDSLGWGIINAGAALSTAAIEADKTAPSSAVKSKRRSKKRQIKLTIESSDGSGTGVDGVDVYVAKGRRGAFRLLSTLKPVATELKFKGRRGQSYRFFSRAIDKAGNREAEPTSPDTKTKIRRRHRHHR